MLFLPSPPPSERWPYGASPYHKGIETTGERYSLAPVFSYTQSRFGELHDVKVIGCELDGEDMEPEDFEALMRIPGMKEHLERKVDVYTDPDYGPFWKHHPTDPEPLPD